MRKLGRQGRHEKPRRVNDVSTRHPIIAPLLGQRGSVSSTQTASTSSMGRSRGIEVNREDIDELVEGHSSELTTEELLYLQQQQQQDLAQEQESSEDEDVCEEASSAVINGMCAKWGELQAFVEKYHPDTTVSNRAVIIFNDTVMVHFRKIVQKRQKQLTMDRFLLKEKRKATAQPDSPPRKRERREKTPEGALPSVIMEGDSPSKE
ncbi:hypothetical protein FHG87_010586 [Trinorchestia longiramus]|nr:hypothetical protein FHG87_010586 [Trinorchestia longiramus]